MHNDTDKDSASPDFDQVHDRLAFHSTKWERYRGRDVLPLWVADMDFAAPAPIRNTLSDQVAHGVFGYTQPAATLAPAVAAYLQRQYGWAVDPVHLVWLGGLVSGLNLTVCAATEPDDAVAVCSPVYPPFLGAPALQGRRLIDLPLVGTDMHWTIDWPALEHALAQGVRLLLFCHPHNPVGRAWRDDELARLAGLLQRYDACVCSDEIHCDLILEPNRRHRPLAGFPGMEDRCITLMGPGKTFNIAGLGIAFAVIPNVGLRRRFIRAMQGLVPGPCGPAYAALEAAVTQCEPWRRALIVYLRDNRDLLASALDALGLPATRPEATFLTWIDARAVARSGKDSPAAHFEKHGLGLSDGAPFGAPGFVRFNFGCRRETLLQAIERLHRACRG